MDPLSDVDHITRGHLSEKTSLLIRVNIFLNLHQKCSYSNLPISYIFNTVQKLGGSKDKSYP